MTAFMHGPLPVAPAHLLAASDSCMDALASSARVEPSPTWTWGPTPRVSFSVTGRLHPAWVSTLRSDLIARPGRPMSKGAVPDTEDAVTSIDSVTSCHPVGSHSVASGSVQVTWAVMSLPDRP